MPISAHTGRTDSNGGHVDSGSGEYHYHHGYPAHAHFDMNGDGIIDCPYDFDDQTNQSSNSSSSGSSGSRPESDPYTNGYKDGYEKGLLDGSEDGHSKGEAAARKDYKEQLAAVKWIAFSVTVLVIILLLAVFRKILIKQSHSFNQEIRNLKSKQSMEIDRFQSAHRSEIHKLTADKNSLVSEHVSEVRKINATSHAEIDRLQAKIKAQRYNDTLYKIISGEDKAISFPKGIRFKHSFTPVKGNIRPNYPYGDYTVFIVDGRKKYHCRHDCAANAKRLHFFDLPLDADPCLRCVPKDMYPQPLPDWYYQIQEKLDSQS